MYIKVATLSSGGAVESRATVGQLTVSSNPYAKAQNVISFPDPAVGPNGDVYVAYYSGVSEDDTGVNIDVAKSSDGGSNFTFMKTFSITGAYQDALGYIRVSSIPTMVVDPTNGNIYLAFVESGNGYHVYFTRSTDGGSSWSTPTIVTQNTTGDQVFPWLTINSTGHISVVYYRENANIFMTSYSNWVNIGTTRLPGVSYTTDGGASWSITDSVIITPGYVSPVSFGEKLFATGGHLYSSFSIGGVDELEDGKWVNVFQNANGLWLAGDSPDNIFGLGSFGYLYWYNGASWTSLNVGANSSIVFFDAWSNGSQTFITGNDYSKTYIFHGY